MATDRSLSPRGHHAVAPSRRHPPHLPSPSSLRRVERSEGRSCSSKTGSAKTGPPLCFSLVKCCVPVRRVSPRRGRNMKARGRAQRRPGNRRAACIALKGQNNPGIPGTQHLCDDPANSPALRSGEAPVSERDTALRGRCERPVRSGKGSWGGLDLDVRAENWPATLLLTKCCVPNLASGNTMPRR